MQSLCHLPRSIGPITTNAHNIFRVVETVFLENGVFAPYRKQQGGSGTEPEPETGTVGTVFPETESGTGTAGTVFQEPKPEPEPFLLVKLY